MSAKQLHDAMSEEIHTQKGGINVLLFLSLIIFFSSLIDVNLTENSLLSIF